MTEKNNGSFWNKKHRILMILFCTAMVFLFFWAKSGTPPVQSWLGNALGMTVVLFPAGWLLWDAGKSETLSPKARLCAKIAFWYILVCVLSGVIASFIAGT
ncbi:MAG: hypothetical protein IJZ08_06965 [Clostridia bacterium]|nr:hypothetical protein [Clostridia bacterium]